MTNGISFNMICSIVMKKILLVAIIFLVLAGLLIKTPKKPVEKKLQKVTVMVNNTPSVSWIPYYTAINKKYYLDEGLDVEMQYSTKGNAGPIEQIVGGKVDFIQTGKESIIMAREKGVDIVSVYPITPANVYYIVSEKSKNITKPSDLIGKKVGLISSASGAYINLLVILNLEKIDKNDVEIVQAGTTVVTGFLEKKYDVAAVHLNQEFLIKEKIPDLSVIKANDYTDVSGGHVTVSGKLIKNNPELINKFLRATKKGLEYSVKNPQEAIEIYLGINPDAASQKKVSQDLWNVTIQEQGFNKNLPGANKLEDWKKSQDVLFDSGLITKKTDVSAMFTNKFIPK